VAARRVVGVDFAGALLRVGKEKIAGRRLTDRIALVRGDATTVPVADGSVDAVTVAFGIRNVEDPAAACREMRRVLKTGGRLAILEFGLPTAPGLRQAYSWYFNHVLPRVGGLVSRDRAAYGYLPASVKTFTPPDELIRMLERHGFVNVRAEPLTFGVVYLYTAARA
jgi:demethylmenaquinone methyltransferase/2-methoxy-6-polyprenyl-1,4-benzoquinol methylase